MPLDTAQSERTINIEVRTNGSIIPGGRLFVALQWWFSTWVVPSGGRIRTSLYPINPIEEREAMNHDTRTKHATADESRMSFLWPQAGAPLPAVSDWIRMQQELVDTVQQFSQEAMTMVRNDMEVSSDAMRRLMLAKTAEEISACQRDMVDLISSKYFEQWLKLGNEMQSLFSKAATKAKHNAEAAAEPSTVEVHTRSRKAA